jgi:hypothetical protein
MTEPKPYERTDRETAKAFEAFVVYRDLGTDRTIAQAAEILGKHPTQLAKWSCKHGWIDRTRAFDNDRDRAGTDAMDDEIEAMRRRQTKAARRIQELGLREIERACQRAEESGEPLNLGETQKLLKLGAELERLNLGEPTENKQLQVEEIDYSKLSVEQLKALRSIKKDAVTRNYPSRDREKQRKAQERIKNA